MRQQTVGLPSDGLQRPERGTKTKEGLYKSGCTRLACEADENHAVHKPLSEEDYKAYRAGTVGDDWFPYFHDQERYQKLKGFGDARCAQMGMTYEWRERNWEEVARREAELRAADPTRTDDDFETGFEDDKLYLGSFGKGRLPAAMSGAERPFASGKGCHLGKRTQEDACRLANEWHLSVLSDQARDESKWEQWVIDQYAELFEEDNQVNLGDRPDEFWPFPGAAASQSPRSPRVEGASKADQPPAAHKNTPAHGGYPEPQGYSTQATKKQRSSI